MSVETLVADVRADKARELESKIIRLTRALARLGCSCTQKTREMDVEAHERFCQYRMAVENLQ